MIAARRYRVIGRVQGVGFRFFAHQAAAAEGLHGWVRNLPDGSVEVWAEGDAESVERFERHLRRGPASAHVEAVDASIEVPQGRPTGFDIR